MENLTLIDIAGIIGAILVVGAYFLNQIGRLPSESLVFPIVNMIGSSLIVWSLIYEFNAGAFVIEACWVVISLIGIIRHLIIRRRT
ncbi:MAG: hypothetical protein ABJK39_11165 [Hyphomicrobiales bacterium]